MRCAPSKSSTTSLIFVCFAHFPYAAKVELDTACSCRTERCDRTKYAISSCKILFKGRPLALLDQRPNRETYIKKKAASLLYGNIVCKRGKHTDLKKSQVHLHRFGEAEASHVADLRGNPEISGRAASSGSSVTVLWAHAVICSPSN